MGNILCCNNAEEEIQFQPHKTISATFETRSLSAQQASKKEQPKQTGLVTPLLQPHLPPPSVVKKDHFLDCPLLLQLCRVELPKNMAKRPNFYVIISIVRQRDIRITDICTSTMTRSLRGVWSIEVSIPPICKEMSLVLTIVETFRLKRNDIILAQAVIPSTDLDISCIKNNNGHVSTTYSKSLQFDIMEQWYSRTGKVPIYAEARKKETMISNNVGSVSLVVEQLGKLNNRCGVVLISGMVTSPSAKVSTYLKSKRSLRWASLYKEELHLVDPYSTIQNSEIIDIKKVEEVSCYKYDAENETYPNVDCVLVLPNETIQLSFISSADEKKTTTFENTIWLDMICDIAVNNGATIRTGEK